MEAFPLASANRVKLIARTETGKAYTMLTMAQSEDLDIPAYEWETSIDARVRSSHNHMQGVIVFWHDPPSPEALIGIKSVGKYHAGNIYNFGKTQKRGASKVKVKYVGESFGVDSLTNGEIYAVLGVEFNFLRVIDDSMEDYLYDATNPAPMDRTSNGGRWEVIEDDIKGTLKKIIDSNRFS